MYREFQTIAEAYRELKEELWKSGMWAFNKRTGKLTKEFIGVMLKIPVKTPPEFYKERPENLELETSFDEALKIVLKDNTARYAIGTPNVNFHGDLPPCPIAVQILLRNKPIVITYFRSENIEQLPADFSVIARKTYNFFGEGEIIWVVGSLHYEVG